MESNELMDRYDELMSLYTNLLAENNELRTENTLYKGNIDLEELSASELYLSLKSRLELADAGIKSRDIQIDILNKYIDVIERYNKQMRDNNKNNKSDDKATSEHISMLSYIIKAHCKVR
ncbi:MAG: hypothetical protein ACRCXT_04940 [Paraclostridium sp.]